MWQHAWPYPQDKSAGSWKQGQPDLAHYHSSTMESSLLQKLLYLLMFIAWMTDRDCCSSVDWTSQRLKCGILHLLIFSAGKSQFSSVSQSCSTLCNPMDWTIPGFPVHHQLPKLAQTHVHQVSDAIQPSHPLSSPSPPDFNPSQHHHLFQKVSSSHQVAKVLEFQLQHQSFQWIFRTDFL